ncbi:hypothetical protein [Mucisphaera calidilacus]|uniref:Uncharacterized protein n=1 Tax=Mucisphaera calidilacus TaxID=2527982 RepID=A0A518BXA9_9BACT|nr:hypothetical protein [Mucisphaera calidilacus]QDU71596.1 hypothetical protein Pan265_14480 [Mucisphaera calidilacus]
MGWFQRLCRNAGLAIHHATAGVSDQTHDRPQPKDQATQPTEPGETVQRVRRVTIEEVEIRSRPADDDRNDPEKRDEPPLIP